MAKIEQKTAKVLLQEQMSVTIGGKAYKTSQPTIATLVMASEKISHLPVTELSKDDILTEALAIAPQCREIAEIIAIFILGAKAVRSQENGLKAKFYKLLHMPYKSEFRTITDELYYNATPSQLNKALAELIMAMEIGDFFGLTTTLLSINLTREKMKKATASGR